jgi:hypothetical protein
MQSMETWDSAALWMYLGPSGDPVGDPRNLNFLEQPLRKSSTVATPNTRRVITRPE